MLAGTGCHTWWRRRRLRLVYRAACACALRAAVCYAKAEDGISSMKNAVLFASQANCLFCYNIPSRCPISWLIFSSFVEYVRLFMQLCVSGATVKTCRDARLTDMCILVPASPVGQEGCDAVYCSALYTFASCFTFCGHTWDVVTRTTCGLCIR